MEEIYSPESYGASEHIHLKSHFENLLSKICNVGVPQVDDEISETEYLLAIKKTMGLDVAYNDLKHVSENCSIDHLNCDDEDMDTFGMKLPENINSNTKCPNFKPITSTNLSIHKCLADLEKTDNFGQINIGNKRNYHKEIEFPEINALPDLEPSSDLVISIVVYKPVSIKFFTAKNASDKLRFSHEIVCLGRTKLSELRDAILCSSDIGLYKEVESTSSDLKPLADARKFYPSGFIFIDNVFYNDFRDPNSIDYSAPIIDWAAKKNLKLSSENMEGVLLRDLSPRFGYPYLYMHQGDCEHLLIFGDAKLLKSSDCLHSQLYPHVLKSKYNNNKMCLMCSVSFAKWICVGSDRLPQHKVFLCTDCCNSYNYIDGEKIGQFKLYPYYEKHVVS